MRKKIVITVLALLAIASVALAATTDFVASSNITVSGVTLGSDTTTLLIISGSKAASISFSSGAFTVTDPDATAGFQVGSADTAVKTFKVTKADGTGSVCAENGTAGTSYVTLSTTADTYTIAPSTLGQCTNHCPSVTGAATYNAYPGCGAATCNTGYRLSGSGASGVCLVTGGGGVSGGGGGYTTLGLATPTPTPTPSASASPTPSVSPAVSPAAAAAVKLIRYAGDPKVYVVENNQKRWVQTAEDFTKLGYKWTDIKIAPTTETYPDGTVMKVPSVSAAVTLIRYAGDPRVYVVENSQKRWVKTAEDFNKLGYKWTDIKIAPTTETYPDGTVMKVPSVSAAVTLIRYAGDPRVYVVENSQKRWVKTAEDFNKLGYKWTDVKIAPASETYTTGSDKTAPATAVATFTQTLKRNSKGAEVLALQQKLKDLGYFPANVDMVNNFGPTTQKAVKAFQKANNLSQSGIVDAKTRELLNK